MSPAGNPAIKTRQLWFLIAVAMLMVTSVIVRSVRGKPLPDCDNSVAQAALGKLYDNRHLLHAVRVGSPRKLSDGLTVRYCSATVTWADGSNANVRYRFYRGHHNDLTISMWVDINGGEYGPSF